MPYLEDHVSHYHDHGGKVYSYDTVIFERHSGISIGNVSYYSGTTTRHQQQAGAFAADVRLDNVPKGTTDLLALAVERKVIMVRKWGKVGDGTFVVPVEYMPCSP
jgi:hypothetical protein